MSKNVLPTDKQARKNIPMARGLLDYFPNALAKVAEVSRIANEQHNPGEEMHWAWGKSNDHADTILRHMVDRGTVDDDQIDHSAKVAWRALAMYEEELVAKGAKPGRSVWMPDADPKPVKREETWDERAARRNAASRQQGLPDVFCGSPACCQEADA